jgi:hypothetical protein
MARNSADDIRKHLQDAINDLRRQLTRVEMWASALDGFSRPVPRYQADTEFLLPSRSPKGA